MRFALLLYGMAVGAALALLVRYTVARGITAWRRWLRVKAGGADPEPSLKTSAWVPVIVAALVGLALVLGAKHVELAVEHIVEAREAAGAPTPEFPLDGVWWLRVLSALLEHAGAGAFVAAGVAIFFHVHEFAEFFTSLATGVLIDHEFLRTLSSSALEKLRAGIAGVTVREHIDNPAYGWDSVRKAAEGLLYGPQALFPTGAPVESGSSASGAYRTSYKEFTTIRRMTLRDVFERLGKDSTNLSADEAGRIILEETVVTSYDVISPQMHVAPFKVPMYVELATIASITPREQVRLWVRLADALNESEVQLESRERSGTRYYDPPTGPEEQRKLLAPFTQGKTSVWMKSVDYKLPGEPFLLNTMSVPTRGAHVSLTVEPALGETLHHRVFALGGETIVSVQDANRLELTHESWFLKDHGWCIWW